MAKKASKKAASKTAKHIVKKKNAKKGVTATNVKTGNKAAKKRTTEKAVELPDVQKELKKRWEVLNIQRLAAEAELTKVHDEIMDMPNVTGVHVGLRKRKLSKTSPEENWVSPLQFCIRVHVKEKFADERDPRIYSLLPKNYGAVPVDVFQQSYNNRPTAGGPIPGRNAANAGGVPTDSFCDPVEGGVPIATVSNSSLHWGTLGGVFFSGDGIRYLTNCHVAGSSVNVKIQQPPSGTVPAGQEPLIGSVLDAEKNQTIDAALVEPEGPRDRSRSIVGLPSPFFVSGVLTTGDEHQTRAFKVGATTGLTRGTVKSVRASVIVGDTTMTNQIIVEPDTPGDDLCDGGDSGSLLIVERSKNGNTVYQIVGLVHAEGSPNGDNDFRSIIACHFYEVQKRFGITVE